MHTTTDASTQIRAVEPARLRLRDHVIQIERMRACELLAYWDERVMMPAAAATWRTAQRTLLSRQLHELLCSPATEAALRDARDALGDDPEVRSLERAVADAERVPTDLAARFTEASSRSYASWLQARETSDFSALVEPLSHQLSLAREIADCHEWSGERYAAALAQWEPGVDSQTVDRLMGEVERGIAPLVQLRPSAEPRALARELDDATRHALERDVLGLVGFDRSRGRIDDTVRAFCIAIAPDDVRIGSRFNQTPYLRGIHSTLHEAGHAIYAQSFARLGVPLGLAQPPGLGLDEAMSRLVENQFGRGQAFCDWLAEWLHANAPGAFDDFDGSSLRAEFASAEHPARRLGCDEITYNLHIVVRWKLERALINGDLDVAGIPSAWSETSEAVLGVRPDSLLDGCLHDVHWSIGQWGYFPTYTLGNIYGAQLLKRAAIDDVHIQPQFDTVESLVRLQSWLDSRVWSAGNSTSGIDLVARVSEREVGSAPLITYLRERYESGID